MNAPAQIGHNRPPPDPLNEALDPYGDYLAEAETWLDGTPVETEAQMRAVDALLRQIKAADKAVTAAKEAEAAPLRAAWQAALARIETDTLERAANRAADLGNTYAHMSQSWRNGCFSAAHEIRALNGGTDE